MIELNPQNLPKIPSKRESISSQRQSRNLSTRDYFYEMILSILATMKESTRRDIRMAKERELQRRSIVS
jgi:hypothetical protein